MGTSYKGFILSGGHALCVTRDTTKPTKEANTIKRITTVRVRNENAIENKEQTIRISSTVENGNTTFTEDLTYKDVA